MKVFRVVGLESQLYVSDGQLVFAQVHPHCGPVGVPQGKVVVGGVGSVAVPPTSLGELEALVVEGEGVVGIALGVGKVAFLSESTGQLVVLGIGHAVQLQLGTELRLWELGQKL